MSTIYELLARASVEAGGAPSLLGPERAPLSYAELSAQIARTAAALRSAGVGAEQRVALLVENGPEAASAFLGIACAAAALPLNPAYRTQELEFALDDARADALVISSTLDSPGRAVATARGIPVIDLERSPEGPAGAFTLSRATSDSSRAHADPVAAAPPRPDSVALLLHTSGTTARPKLVPLRQRHLVASALNVAGTLALRPGDRCLNVMPLFHIHGIVAALLASVAARAAVACTPGFHVHRFYGWLDTLAPTWYTAVPTMHQAVIERAADHPDVISRHTLRLVRSSSAALPVSVLEDLERTFDIPVIEAYGMTEAAHQMASNPLPPGTRKPGSVGLAAGPEIAILGPDGRVLPAGEVGEVSIRGANIFDGYEGNPDANAHSFSGGWFRTGDLGLLGDDEYLTLVGRSKEIINRGGEKISPLEVEDVLIRHPSVRQAVVFAIMDARLGEEVGAAVVASSEGRPDPRQLQDFVAQTLAPFKVPRHIVVVDEVPKGPTGKLQRIGLAEQLEIGMVQPLHEDRPALQYLEGRLTAIWEAVLDAPGLDAGSDFFAHGGDSILGTEAVCRIRDLMGDPEIPLVAIVRAPTPAAMASEVYAYAGRGASGIVQLNGNDASQPLFLVHAGDGEVILFTALGRRLVDLPINGLRARGIDDGHEPHASIVEMAADYVRDLRRVQPHGPYRLGGFCLGGAIAVEMAAQLAEDDAAVELLVLIDPRFRRPRGARYAAWLARKRRRDGVLTSALARHVLARIGLNRTPEVGSTTMRHLAKLREAYSPRPIDVPVALLTSANYGQYALPEPYIRSIALRIERRIELPFEHEQLFLPPAVDRVAAELVALLTPIEVVAQ